MLTINVRLITINMAVAFVFNVNYILFLMKYIYLSMIVAYYYLSYTVNYLNDLLDIILLFNNR